MNKKEHGKPNSKFLAVVKYRTEYDKKFIGNSGSYTLENERNFWVVMDVRDGSVLCESSDCSYTSGVRYWLHFPIQWKEYFKCEEWVKTGCIGEMQENFQNLDIGFHTGFVTLDSE